jgi:hypothetical protein
MRLIGVDLTGNVVKTTCSTVSDFNGWLWVWVIGQRIAVAGWINGGNPAEQVAGKVYRNRIS